MLIRPKFNFEKDFTYFPIRVIREVPDLTAYDLVLYLVLLSHVGEEIPSQAVLAQEAKCSVRSVGRALAHLRELGLLGEDGTLR